VKRHVIDQLNVKEKDKGDSFKWLWIKDMARSKVKNKLAYSLVVTEWDNGNGPFTLTLAPRSN
jgi:signal transduction histidine kinase